MQGDYEDLIEKMGKEIAEAILDREPELTERARLIDKDVADILRRAGQATMILIFAVLGAQLTEEAKAAGLTVQSRTVITYNVIFGPIEVESPYLWSNGQSSKPVKDRMGLTHQGRSESVERALTDFGIEESFGQAAKRFEEHYGWPVDKSTVRRVTESVAAQAEEYVEERLDEERRAYGLHPGVDQLVVELDACKIRTGVLIPHKEVDRESDQPEKRDRVVSWRDVRIGLVTDLDGQEKGYVGRMDSYPEVVDQLFSMAVVHGLSEQTRVIAVSDGGNGLREELERQFPRIQFILDHTHLKDQFYQTAEAMGYEPEQRKEWVEGKLELIDTGRVHEAFEQVRQEYAVTSLDRIRQLIGYMDRFQDAMDYQKFKDEGLPIGSGEVESAHRYVPQKRLKLPGAFWHPGNINPMVSLRVLRADDWWNDFWEDRSTKRAAA
jgi:hypothetical protein